MGSWFSNIQVRKGEGATVDSVAEYITKWMREKSFIPTDLSEDADGVFAIATDDTTDWLAVYSDLYDIHSPKEFRALARPLSQTLLTDVLGIACFDSDYLYMNLINAHEKVDAWMGVGHVFGLGLRRWTGLPKWKKKVHDYDKFRISVRNKYDFAEEVLAEIEPCLHLSEQLSMLSLEYLSEYSPQYVRYLYFKLPDALRNQEPPVFHQKGMSLMPCFLEQPATVRCNNVGGGSRGLSIYFLGSYVEKDEITFSDVSLILEKPRRWIPIQLNKEQLPDGRWAYAYHDPDFKIPDKVDPRLPAYKQYQLNSEREIVVRFVPNGNPRKILDITVAFVPDKNPDGRTVWNLVEYYGSKKTLIEKYNATWSKYKNSSVSLLREEDFD